MTRLIDADAMHKFVEDKVAEGKDWCANGVPFEWAYALTAVDLQPTVDAVPVVRCKDCKHSIVANKEGLYGYCQRMNTCFLPFQLDTREHFCSKGERKDNG